MLDGHSGRSDDLEALEREHLQLIYDQKHRFLTVKLIRRVDKISTLVDQLAHQPQNLELTTEVAREIHSLFGSAKLYKMPVLLDAIHPVERELVPIYHNPRQVSPEFIDFLRRFMDNLKGWADRVRDEAKEVDLSRYSPPKA